jgi:SAM-dependent methyltransferase
MKYQIACGIGMQQIAERVYGSTLNQAVLSLIERRHRVVLDVGCGSGAHAEVLASNGKTVDGITLSEKEARLARSHCRNVLVYDLERGLPNTLVPPYDLCLCSHVLEHLRNPSPLLTAVHSVLAAGGNLLVALPNLLHYRHRWQLLRGRFDYTSGGIMDSTHVRWYTWETGRELLESHGFVVDRQLADGGFPLPKLRGLLAASAIRSLDRFAVKRMPGLCGWQHLYLARSA